VERCRTFAENVIEICDVPFLVEEARALLEAESAAVEEVTE
jgi:hypothetical protein